MKKIKNFFKMFDFMELNLNSRSYKSGFIRMAVSLLVIFAVCAIRLNITIANVALNIVLTLVSLAIVIMSVLCFFVAAVECLQVGDNRKKDKIRENLEKRQ
jgi:hypothetical protein